MKKSNLFVWFSIASLALASCSSGGSKNKDGVDPSIADNNKTASNPGAENPEPKFEFDQSVWDFGTINEGERVKHIYKFTNAGNEDLVINKVTATCGCTVPQWTKQPIPPGESGEIEVKFDSKNKPGNQVKEVTVISNTVPPTTILTFKATVLPGN